MFVIVSWKYLKNKMINIIYVVHLVTYLYVGGVMVSVLASSAVDRGFEPWTGQTKNDKTGNCCFSTKHAALRRKKKHWLTRNQDNVSSADCCFSELALQNSN